ncbi:MAG: hypothetical protein A3E84_05450 [Gammaproteobacteria bacterium RIFCSPHIGHO2_12_FULL_42_13]|nr:MAG: hypothetical protein A3E84_05450 [Gammaproteobacteria bacterium RIFCSPHIGHO2_12_FULL_42_13]
MPLTEQNIEVIDFVLTAHQKAVEARNNDALNNTKPLSKEELNQWESLDKILEKLANIKNFKELSDTKTITDVLIELKDFCNSDQASKIREHAPADFIKLTNSTYQELLAEAQKPVASDRKRDKVVKGSPPAEKPPTPSPVVDRSTLTAVTTAVRNIFSRNKGSAASSTAQEGAKRDERDKTSTQAARAGAGVFSSQTPTPQAPGPSNQEGTHPNSGSQVGKRFARK